MALSVLHRWQDFPICGCYLVPEHVERRPLFNIGRPGLEQVVTQTISLLEKSLSFLPDSNESVLIRPFSNPESPNRVGNFLEGDDERYTAF